LALVYIVLLARKHPGNVCRIPIAAATIALLSQFRYYVGYMAVVAFAPALAWPLTKGRAVWSVIGGLAFLLLALVGLIALQEPQHLGQLNANFGFDSPAFYERFRDNVSVGPGGGSGVRNRFDLHHPLGIVAALVFGAAHLLLAPFPWNFAGASPRLICAGLE